MTKKIMKFPNHQTPVKKAKNLIVSFPGFPQKMRKKLSTLMRHSNGQAITIITIRQEYKEQS